MTENHEIRHMKPRKLARSVARNAMDKSGITGYNKPRFFNGVPLPSQFAQGWKKAAKEVLDASERRRRPKHGR